MKWLDLNVDIGEGYPHDEELIHFATSANVCCGEHAGSWALTVEAIEACISAGIRIGMHPGFPDRESMGRRTPVKEEWEEFGRSVLEQCHRFWNFAPPAYLKPHGAWYNMLGEIGDGGDWARDLLCEALRQCNVQPMLLPKTAQLMGFENAIIEGFADRRYLSDGSLVPRTRADAILHDPGEIRAQVLRLAKTVDSICLHGDTFGCLEFAELVYSALVSSGYEVGA